MSEFRGGPAPGKCIPASLLRCKHWSVLPAKAALIQGSFKLIRNLPLRAGSRRCLPLSAASVPGDVSFSNMHREPRNGECSEAASPAFEKKWPRNCRLAGHRARPGAPSQRGTRRPLAKRSGRCGPWGTCNEPRPVFFHHHSRFQPPAIYRGRHRVGPGADVRRLGDDRDR